MKRSSRKASLLVSALLLWLCMPAPSAEAQSKVRIAGVVKDLEGNPIEGATIEITNPASARVWTVETKKDGKWAAIVEGKTWKFVAKAKGFFSLEEVRPLDSLGKRPTLNFTLAPGDDNAAAQAAALAAAPPVDEGTPVPQVDLADLKAGNLLFDQGQYKEARASYETALTKNPTLLQIHIAIGDACVKLEDWSAAAEHYKQVPDTDPMGERALLGLANCYVRLQKTDAAVAAYKQVLEKDPTNPDANYVLGQVIFNEKNDAQAALPYLEAAVTAKPDWVAAQVKLGYVHVNLGNNDKAKAAFQKALELDPANAEVKSMLEMFK